MDSADLPVTSATKDVDANTAYFIAADSNGECPRGGLVQLEYRNTHLSYALTWFAMAFLLVVCIIIILRHKDDDGP